MDDVLLPLCPTVINNICITTRLVPATSIERVQTIRRALAYASMAIASLPGVFAAICVTALAISISDAPSVHHHQQHTRH